MDMGVIILTGKSCSGKDSVRRELEKWGYNNIVSYTSRPIRENEIDGIDYNFVNRSQFEKMITTEQMIEYRTYNTLVNNIPDKWYYGLKKEKLDPEGCCVVVLDLDGTENFIKHYGKKNCYVVYICCPKGERERRAIERSSLSKSEWNKRFKSEWNRRLIADDKDFKTKKLEKLIDFTVVNMSDDINDIPKIAKILNRMYIEKFNKED